MMVVPKGGFSLVDEECNGASLEAFDREGIIQRVLQNRIDNDCPIGDPEKYVDSILSKRSAIYHVPQTGGTIAQSSRPVGGSKSLLERARDWLASKYANREKQPLKYVNKPEADRRARICVGCKFNQEWRNACAPCVDRLEATAVLVAKGKFSDYHPELKACALMGHENSVAVFLDKKNLKHSLQYSKKAPKKCWLK